MLRKNREQAQNRLILFGCDDPGLEIGFLKFAQVHFPTPLGELLNGLGKLRFTRLLGKNLSGLEKTEHLVAHRNGHAGVTQPGKTFHRTGSQALGLGNLLLRFKAGGACAILFSHEHTKRILRFLSVMRALPGFDGAQAQRQSGGLAEGAFVVLIDLRLRKGLNELLVVASIHTAG
jgi:hypothetical protein